MSFKLPYSNQTNWGGFVLVGPSPAPPIGSALGGGYYAASISTAGTGVADYYLIVAPKSTGQSTSVQWKTSETATPGTYSDIDGPTNSENMNNASHPAAFFCKGRTIGGYTDWYMPAFYELQAIYQNLKPGTTANDTAWGINNYSVPKQTTNYTSSNPAQTSATDFKTGGSQSITEINLWCSTATAAPQNAWTQWFGDGVWGDPPKTYPGIRVRAVRRVPV